MQGTIKDLRLIQCFAWFLLIFWVVVATTLDEKIKGEERKKREIQENITKDAVHLQVTWKSISAGGYVTYNASTTYKSDYLAAISQMRRIGDYSLRDAELLADSPFVDAFFGMQPTQQEIENSPLEQLLTNC